MAFCIYCGKKLGDTDRFCGACGAKVEAPEPVAVPAEVPAAPVVAPAAPVADPIATVIYNPTLEETPAAAPLVEQEAAEAPAVEEPVAAEPVVAEPVVAEPVVERTVFSAPVEEVIPAAPAVEEPIPQEPLYAAPITREHVRTAATPAAAQPMPFGNKSARGSSASYSYATEERVNNPVQHKAVRPKRKFVAAFFSVILCILLLIAMMPTYTLLTVRCALTKETFLTAMKRVELRELPATILDEHDKDLWDKSVAEAICDELNDELSTVYPEWTDLTPQKLDQYLDESAFLPFIAEHAEGILKAVVNGKTSYKIPTKQIVDLVEKDIEYLTSTLDLFVEEVDPEQFAEDIVVEFDLDDVVLPTPSDLDEDARLALDILAILMSFYPVGAACLVLLLLVLLLFAANHRDPMYAVRDIGIVSVLGTILPLMLIFGARGAVSYFAGQAAEEYLVCLVTSCILDSTFLLVACVFGLGVVLLIVNGIVRKVQNKKYMA